MRIAKISIDGFGVFDDAFTLEFPGDVALIVGDNETGKSTIFSAIDAILFGLSKEDEKSAFAPYGQSAPRSGFLEIETTSGRCRLTRDFASNHARVEMLSPTERVLFDGSAKPSGRSDEKEAYDAVMRDLLGFESSDVFRNSVMTKQSGLPPEMQSIVRRIVTGSSSADYVTALENLRAAAEDLSMDIPWRSGTARKQRAIERVAGDIQEKKRRLSEMRAAAHVVSESRDRLTALESEMAEAADAVEDKKAWREALESFARALKDRRTLERQVNEHRQRMRQVEKLTDELKSLAARIDTDFSQFVGLPDNAAGEIAGLDKLIDSEKDLNERRSGIEAEAPRFRLSPFAIAMIMAGLVVAGIGLFVLGGTFRILICLLGVGALIAPIVRAYLAVRSQQLERGVKLGELERQIESLASQIKEMRERYPALAHSHPPEFLGRLSEFKQLLQKKKEIETALDQYDNLGEIVSEYDRLSNELVMAESRISELKSRRPSLGDIEEGGGQGSAMEEVNGAIPGLERKLREIAAEREDVVRALAAAEAKEIVSEETLEDEIGEAETRLERLQLSRSAHILAVEALEEAEAEFRRAHLMRIRERTTSLLEQITNRRCTVSLDEKLEPTGVERDGQSLEMEQLSQGVRDQLHFALRLAAVEEISGKRRLPVLLDDPFVNFDERRLKAALETLDKLSRSHQIVLLTHDRRYCDWRKPACVLERRAVRKTLL